MKFKNSIFIFRRDLRLFDNTGLNEALKQSENVFPCFIYNPIQVTDKNKFKSNNCLQFMNESLDDLASQLKTNGSILNLLYGPTEKVITDLIKNNNIEAIFVNNDYTPFSKKRDQSIAKLCKKLKIEFFTFEDALLNPPEKTLKKDNKPYTVFTPYWRNASKFTVETPIKTLNSKSLAKATAKISASYKKLSSVLRQAQDERNNEIATHGGRKNCLAILNKISQFKDYSKTHDIPCLKTTMLSAHNKFGTCSIREVYHKLKDELGRNHPILRQLYWRDFFTQITYFFPHVLGKPFKEKYLKLNWKNSKPNFKKWCEGKTGFPIVDAGMHELNTTGFMHNRVRMITASFLIKDLHINWLWGEKYFAQNLVDYDPAVNNGNWQWVASTGCDAQPYFRIFNPWNQQKRFDPGCEYIKKWIPELKNVPARDIHNWHKKHSEFDVNYPAPMVDHNIESVKTKEYFKKLK
ncbi:MAG: Deoxyribodipyrimidine photo-lyase [candidate division TM6 bacterium GW2011_GWF2_32_72]|nr:MAG: Deoxyribodipyrimidine photo-lyase [candidate division TM6 bacterium GW2011_GWF2_32_72]